jgi:hypothetical protein
MKRGHGYRIAILVVFPLITTFTSLNCSHNGSGTAHSSLDGQRAEQVSVSEAELEEIRRAKQRLKQNLPIKQFEWTNHLSLEKKVVNAWTGAQHLYLETSGHDLWAISRRTGNAVWVYSLNSALRFPPAPVSDLPSRVRDVEQQIMDVKDQLSTERAKINPDEERISEIQTNLQNLRSQLNSLRETDRLYVIAGTTLHAVDRKLGSQVDQKSLTFAPSAQPFATSNRLVIAGYRQNFIHFYPHNTLNENLDERVRLDSPIESGINQAEDLFLLPGSSGTLYGYSLEQGWVWRKETGGELQARPVVYDGNVILASRGMELFSLSRFSGNSNWVSQFETPISQTPQVADSSIYVYDEKDRFSAVDADSGELKWRHKNGPDSLLFRVENQVYAKSDDTSTVIRLSTEDGEVLSKGSYEPFSYLLPNEQEPVFLFVSDHGLIITARVSTAGVEFTTENIERNFDAE